MLTIDLPKLAERLRGLGFDAYTEDGRTAGAGPQTALYLGGRIYPLWELNLEENRDALERLDFDAIRNRRGPDWTVARPVKLGPQ